MRQLTNCDAVVRALAWLVAALGHQRNAAEIALNASLMKYIS